MTTPPKPMRPYAMQRPLVAGEPLHADDGAVERPVCRVMIDALAQIADSHRIEAWHLWLSSELIGHAYDVDDPLASGVLALVVMLLARVDDGDVMLRLDPAGSGPVRDLMASLDTVESQSTSHDLADCVARASRALSNLESDSPAADSEVSVIGSSLAVICGGPSTDRPLVVEAGRLYLHRLHRAESRVAVAVARRAMMSDAAVDSREVDAAIADVVERPAHYGGTPIALAAEQIHAVRAACLHPVTVVSGGPGTGKTSVVVAILRALVRLGLDPGRIALAAPTGKAAWRMGEALEQGLDRIPRSRRAAADIRLGSASLEPQTIHRLLRWSPSAARFEYSERLPLPADVVIIDESSMVPLALMDQVIAAVRPGARLILLGDADQLPSVEAGSVFADLAPPRGAPPTPVASSSIRLQRSFRMREDDPAGRAILSVARRIRDGDVSLTTGSSNDACGIVRRALPEAVAGFGVEAIDARGEALEAVVVGRLVDALFGTGDDRDRWLRPRIRGEAGFDESVRGALHALFDDLESTRVLCVTRRGPRGADAVSARVDDHIRASDPRAAQGIGAPILVTRNDARRGLFNGDLGVVLDVRTSGADEVTPRVVFRRGDRFVIFAPAAIAGITRRSWALTVHKAQGSEVDDLVLVLPTSDGPLLNRAVLYTALTRARRSVVIVGSDDQIRAAIDRDRPRVTRLPDRLELHWQTGAS